MTKKFLTQSVMHTTEDAVYVNHMCDECETSSWHEFCPFCPRVKLSKQIREYEENYKQGPYYNRDEDPPTTTPAHDSLIYIYIYIYVPDRISESIP